MFNLTAFRGWGHTEPLAVGKDPKGDQLEIEGAMHFIQLKIDSFKV